MRDELASIDMHGRPEFADRSAERALSRIHNPQPTNYLARATQAPRIGTQAKYTAFQASRRVAR